MVIDPLVDTIIIVTFLVTTVKTIYHNCIKSKKIKQDDNIIKSKKDNTTEKTIILKGTQSLVNLKLFYKDTSYDEESNISLSSPVQKSYECFQCHKKLQGFYKKDYFAFDKEYCESCWKKIHLKIISKPS